MDKSGDPVSLKSAPGAHSQERQASAWLVVRHWLREPLVHFLLIGLLLFVASGARNHSSHPGSNRIELTVDDVRQLQMGFAAQWERQPTSQELSGLIESRIRDEILYREALALGLDKDDNIVKRRMAQKMEFLSEDVANAHEPNTAELRAWYEKNGERFAQPSRATFRHLYFSPDRRRGQRAYADAVQALSKIVGQPQDSKTAAALADRFMFQDYYGDRSPEQLAKEFGPQFAQSIFKLKPGSWQGPIESGYGWHLVFVESFTTGRIPAFEEVEPDVKTAWLSDQRAEEWRKAYATMRAKYQVALPAPAASDEPRVASAPPAKMVAPTTGPQ
jgi:peptidyl-prolyl cis-trans isomerase C